MRVTVVLFASLRDAAGTASEICDFAGPASIGDVWREMLARHPALAPFTDRVTCARNVDFARLSTTVTDGDEIAFLPPVSGGAPGPVRRRPRSS